MKTSELRSVLLELANFHEGLQRHDEALALRKLVEAFDGPQNQSVTKAIDQIRKVRKLPSLH
jgi:hypothetical protein